jgi:hypothetical protein
VKATEPGNSYNIIAPISVIVDVRQPKFIDVNPIDGTYVGGNTHIRATLEEANVDTWRVQVNGADIPNNSGSSNTVDVLWDTSPLLSDGTQTISITVDDKAKNSSSRSMSVTLDRRPPTTTVMAPANGYNLPPRSSLAVVLSIADQFQGSLDRTGIDVMIKTLDNRFVTRVARRSINQDGSRLIWTGRLRSTKSLPGHFKIVVTAVDKAGNVAVVQEVRVNILGQ